jgi:DNA polymerase I
VIVLDIETDRKASQIWCVCTCDENGKHIVWTTSEGLQQYVNDNAPVIMHNGIGFDAPVLRRLWGIVLKPSQVIDTLCMSRLYRPDIEGGHSLKAWGQRLRGGTLSEIDLPEAKLVAEFLMLQKRVGLVSSWLDAADVKGFVHGRVISNGAVTGRMTHSSPNMGQIPSVSSPYGVECRSCWTVPEGYKLVGCDLSGIELRCLAHYMKDDEWTRELLEGDIHTKNQLAAGLPERNMAKTMIYATLYGAGAAKIGSIVGGGAKEGEQILENFYANTPALRQLQARVGRLAQNGTIKGLDGRRLHIRSERAVLNTLLQSCGAIIAKQWCVEIHKELLRQGLTAHVMQCAFVHDEIQMAVKEKYCEIVAKIMVDSAAKAGVELDFRVKVDAEAKTGSHWADTH